MQAYKVIQQIDKQTFRVINLDALNDYEFQSKKISLGITFDDVSAFDWSANEYPVGRFVIKWGGKKTADNAYLFYLNKTSGTKTFIDLVKDVPDLETVAQLMNKYANLNTNQVWELLENSINRLGHYHRLNGPANERGIDQGYKSNDLETFDESDYDRQCIQDILDAQQIAVTLQQKVSHVYRMTEGIDAVNADERVPKIIELLKAMNDEYIVNLKSVVRNSRLGQDHSAGGFAQMKDFKKNR